MWPETWTAGQLTAEGPNPPSFHSGCGSGEQAWPDPPGLFLWLFIPELKFVGEFSLPSPERKVWGHQTAPFSEGRLLTRRSAAFPLHPGQEQIRQGPGTS